MVHSQLKPLRESRADFSPRRFEDAKKRIEKTMQWRREFKPDLIPPEEVAAYNHLCVSPPLNIHDRDAGSN